MLTHALESGDSGYVIPVILLFSKPEFWKQ